MPCDISDPCQIQIKLGILRPTAIIKVVQIKNDKLGNDLDSKGTLALPCACPIGSNHDDKNHACIVSLLKMHKINIQSSKEKFKIQLNKLRNQYEKQMVKTPVPKAAKNTKKKIDKLSNFLNEETHTPLFLRPHFNKKNDRRCEGFHAQAGKGQVDVMK